jgi:hypothetical protein
MSRIPDSTEPTKPIRIMRLVALALLIGLPAAPAIAADKTDVVVLVNGDRITGEIKEMSYGQLTLKTEDIGTIYIEWEKIASMTTTQELQVEMADGRRFFGPAPEPASMTGSIRLMKSWYGEEPVPVELSISDIVRLATVESGDAWYKRLNGSFSLGYSYTKANDLKVLNVSADIGSRDRVRRWGIALDSQVTSQASDPSSQRSTLVSTIERFMPNRYYLEGSLEFTRNEELGLALRSQVGTTLGRYLIQNNNREWRAGLGLAASTERGTDGARRDNYQGQLETTVRMFRFDHPKTDVTASLTLLPSLSESGRLRGEASLKGKWELVNDLFFQIVVYDSYDNKPAESATTNDWGLTTSLGYTF